MTEPRGPQAPAPIAARLWGALKNSLTDEDPVASARRARLQAGQSGSDPAARAAAALPAAGADADADAGAGSAAPPAPLAPMARALLDQVLSRATAYTALTEKLAPLAAVIADERMRYQAAYALIKASRSVEQVVQAIDLQHMQALEAEAARFAAQLQAKEHAEIDARRAELQRLESDVAVATAQAARLREEARARIREVELGLQRDGERRELLAREIDARQHELAGVQQRFEAAAGATRQALQVARATVLRHLG